MIEKPSGTHRPQRRRGGMRRVGTGVIDQLLYSGSNFALTILVAKSASVDQFGAFSLIITSYLIFSVAARGLTSETLVIRFSAAAYDLWRPAARDAAGSSLVLGVAGGLIFLVAGIVSEGSFANSALVIAACLPGLTVQDHLRYSALSRGRPGAALANDATQVVLQFAAAGVLIYLGHDSAPALIAAWGGSAYAGAFVGIVLLRLPLNPYGARRWFAANHDLAIRYALDDLGAQVGQNGASYVLAGVSGLSGPGALRGAQTVFSPPSILNMGIQAASMPDLVRMLKRSSRAMAKLALGIGLAMCAVGALWGFLAMLVPQRVGHSLFGATWTLVHPLLIFFLINQAASGLRLAPMMGLRALGAANRTLVARLITILLAFGTQLVGALVDGVHGVAIANAIAGPLQVAAYWWQFQLALRDHRRIVGRRRHRESWDRLVQSVPDPDRVPAIARWVPDV